MDVKAVFTGRDEEAIINSNLYGEEWAQKAFADALETGILPAEVQQVVEKQRQSSVDVYNTLQQMKASPDYVPQANTSSLNHDNNIVNTSATVAPGSDTYSTKGDF